MSAVLFCKTGLFAGTSFKIGSGASIGKSDTNNIVLRSDIVSGSHAKIIYDESQKAYFLEDLGSSNGTLLDGAKVKGKEKLERLHVITFAGKFDFIFQLGGAIPAQAATPKAAAAPVMEKTVIDKAEQILPSAFGKKEAVQEDKTRFDSPKEAPSPLPSFGKPHDVQKTVFDNEVDAPAPLSGFNKPKEEHKTMYDNAQEAPAALPSFGQPKDEEKTVASKPIEPVLPSFQKKPELKPAGSEVPTAAMRQTVSPQPASRARLALHVPKLNKDFELFDGTTTVGRAIGSDIIIDDVSLSRKHAAITITSDKIIIKDLGSSNGTSVDKKRIGSEVELTLSSHIKLGMVEVKLKKVI